MSKAKKKASPEELLNNEEKDMYACRVWGLQTKLALEKERCDITKSAQLELKQKVIMLTEELKREREKNFMNSISMANEAKEMQEQLSRDIEQLQSKIEEQRKQLNDKDEYLRDLIKSQEAASFKKDDEIRELKRKIDEMNMEFSKMMKVES